MVIPPLIGNPHNGYIRPYYWVDDHPLWKSWEFQDSSNARKSFHTVKMPLTQVVGSHYISNKYHTHSNGSLDPSTYGNGMGTEWAPLSPEGGPMSLLLPGITLDMLVKLDHETPSFRGKPTKKIFESTAPIFWWDVASLGFASSMPETNRSPLVERLLEGDILVLEGKMPGKVATYKLLTVRWVGLAKLWNLWNVSYKNISLENMVYHNFRQLWLVLGVKLMEINSNLFSRRGDFNHRNGQLQSPTYQGRMPNMFFLHFSILFP